MSEFLFILFILFFVCVRRGGKKIKVMCTRLGSISQVGWNRVCDGFRLVMQSVLLLLCWHLSAVMDKSLTHGAVQ